MLLNWFGSAAFDSPQKWNSIIPQLKTKRPTREARCKPIKIKNFYSVSKLQVKNWISKIGEIEANITRSTLFRLASQCPDRRRCTNWRWHTSCCCSPVRGSGWPGFCLRSCRSGVLFGNEKRRLSVDRKRNGSGCSKRTQSDCAAVDVGLLQIQAKILLNRQELCSERFVHFDNIHLIQRYTGLGKGQGG